MLELLGVSTPDFEIDFLKTTIWLHPKGLDNKARLMLKMILRYDEKKKEDTKPKEIEIYFKVKSGLEVGDLYDEKDKLSRKYLEKIGSEYVVDEKDAKMEKILAGKIAIENIPPDSKKGQTYEMTSEEHVEIKLKIKPFSEESFSKNRIWILMVSMILNGKIIEKESILKRLIGVSRFAWRFQYKIWGHKECTPSFSESSIKQCKEAQVYVVIPTKRFISKGHLTLISGGDQTHTISKSDIHLFTESLTGDKKKKDSEWMEDGSCGISWGFAKNIMSLSRDICIEHHEAFPRATTAFFLVSFWVALAMGMGIILYKGESFSANDLIFPGLVFLGTSISLYFWINLKNYSFYELGFPGQTRTLQGFFIILATCVVASASGFSVLVHELTQHWSIILYVLFGLSIIAFGYFGLRSEMEVESRGVDQSKIDQFGRITGPILIVISFLTIIFLVSLLFSWRYIEGEAFYSKLIAFWMFNNFASLLSRYSKKAG